MSIPKKVHSQLVAGLKQMTPLVGQLAARDVSEADTVTLVKDILAEVFGFDKWTELTSEHAVRGTFCDIVIQISGRPVVIIEVKAINTKLSDKHVKQAIDYGANLGIDWVILTNGANWQIYKVLFAKPIDKHLVCEIDLTKLDPKQNDDIEQIYLFTKHAYEKGAAKDIFDRQLAFNRHMIAALLLYNDRVLDAIRRELKRVAEVSVQEVEIQDMLRNDVIKRDAIDGPEAEGALKVVTKRSDRPLRSKSSAQDESGDAPPVSTESAS